MRTATGLLPVVLHHGAGQDGEIWADVAPRLRRPIHVHDAPGHGGRFGELLSSVEELGDDLVAHTPDEADEHGAVLVGHSLGGAVALQAALDHPEAVQGLVLVATGAPRPTDSRMREALEEGDLDGMIAQIRPAFVPLSGEPDPAHERSAERLVRIWRRTGARAIAADYRAVETQQVIDRARPLDIPVAVIGGEADRLVPPRRVRELADVLGVEPQIVAGASHQLPWEDPAAVAITIERIRTAATARAAT